MGGCCCCSSKGVGVNRSPAFYHYPRASEEREPLSSHHDTVAALSTGLLVNTNLETSSPDTYRPPPPPLPYDANLGRPLTQLSNVEVCSNKNDESVHTADIEIVQETISGNDILETVDEDLKKSDCKVQKDTELDSSTDIEVELEKSGELKKSSEPLVLVVEECPTCLEETISGNDILETVDEDLKKSDCKVQKDTELDSTTDIEVELEKSGELKKSSEPLVLVVEECPTCLEEYDDDNPKIITKCEHHFHLACILEWMERSDTCPVCDQEMIFTPPVDG